MIEISPAHNTARLAGTLAFLGAGTGNASIQIYAGPQPAPGAAPAAAPLVTLLLAKPPGVLTTVLTLTPKSSEGEMILQSGEAAWARFVNGAGEWAGDADVGDVNSTAVVKMPSTTLRAGGRCPIDPSSLS